jgi:hypothetical protein
VQHVVYYILAENSEAWDKGGFEGPLLLVKISQEPNNCLIVLNMQHNNSFYQHITAETLFDKKHPQLLCIRDMNKSVYGVGSASTQLIDS